MYKQQEKVIKKGEYYQVETLEETMMPISKPKREEAAPRISSNNVPASEYICTEIPTFSEARESYFCSNALKAEFELKGATELKLELQEMLLEDQMISDEDRKEIEKLINEIESFQNSAKESPLNELPIKSQESAKSNTQQQKPQSDKIELSATYNLKSLSQKISKLDELNFPDLHALEHELEIMLGEKKPIQSVSLEPLNETAKEELNNVFNHLNSLSIMNNLSQTIQNVSSNEHKHAEMQRWINKNEKISGLNNDFLKELKADEELVDRLGKNFEENMKNIQFILEEIKKE